MPFAAFARRALFEPLRMTSSTFEQRSQPRAAGYYDRSGAPVPDFRYAAEAAARLRITAADLGRFVAALIASANGLVAASGALKPATVAQMLTPQPHSANGLLFAGSEWGLGYGLKQLPEGALLASHPGDNIPSWHGMVAAIPVRRAGLVVLTNGEAGRELRLDVFCVWIKLQGVSGPSECAGRLPDR